MPPSPKRPRPGSRRAVVAAAAPRRTRVASRARRAPPPTAVRTEVRQRASDAYRDAIIDAARAEFIDLGYAATKMVDIARRAGMSVGALYRHFDSKEAIFVSLMAHGGERLVTHMAQVAAQVAPPTERLAALLSAALSFIQDNRAMFLLFNQLGDGDRPSCHALAAHAGSIRDRILALYRAALVEGVAAGALRAEVAIDDQLSFFTGAIHGFIEEWMRRGAEGRLVDKAPLIASLTLRSLGGPS